MFLATETATSRLRALLAMIERDVATMSAHVERDEEVRAANRVKAAVAETVELLALGPEPEVRDCPVCGRCIRESARRCGYCWSLLVPSSHEPSDKSEALSTWETEGGRLAPR